MITKGDGRPPPKPPFRQEGNGYRGTGEDDRRAWFNLMKDTTSFYFTNFPENIREKELWSVFQQWGSVREVVIPPKRDKYGKRFGFVRYKGVEHPARMEGNLSTVWFGNLRLRVNVPKYGRGVNGSKALLNKGGLQRNWCTKEAALVKKGFSFANVVGRTNVTLSKANREVNPCGTVSEGNDWRGPSFIVPQEELRWLQGCYVGTLHSFQDLNMLQKKLSEEGLFSVTATSMGGKMVLLSSKNNEDLPSLLPDICPCLERWFMDLKPWEQGMVSRERMNFLRLTRTLHIVSFKRSWEEKK